MERNRARFPSLKSERVYEHIVMHLEHAIFERRLRRGDKLPAERELAAQFSASRVAVREALLLLQLKGLLEVRTGPTGGYFVRHTDADVLTRDLRTLAILGEFSVTELTDVRLAVEPGVARLAAERASSVDHAAIESVLAKRAEASRDDRWRLDLEFHRLIAVAAGNRVYPLLLHSLMQLEADFIIPRYRLSDQDQRDVADIHREIYEGIVTRNAEQAEAAMRRHVMELRTRLLGLAARDGEPSHGRGHADQL